MNNRVPESVDVGFRISTSNKYLHYGIGLILKKIMTCFFNDVSYVKDSYQGDYEESTIYTFHIVEIDSAFIVNAFMPSNSMVDFCFIMPERTRPYVNKGKTVIYVHQTLRIVEQELTSAIKKLIRPKTIRSIKYRRNVNLTPRQRDILHCLLKGISVDEVAMKNNISLKTVYSHRRNIYKALGVRNMAEFYKQRRLIMLLYTDAGQVPGVLNHYNTLPVT